MGWSSYEPLRNQRNAITFEKYVFSLLSALAKSENKDFFSDLISNEYNIDGYAPLGLDDLEEPLIIEVKYITRKDLGRKYFSKIEKQVWSYAKYVDVKKVLFVTNLKRDEVLFEDSNIVVWDGTKVIELAQMFPEVAFQFSDYYIPGFLEYSKKESERVKLIDKTVSKYEQIQYNANKEDHINKLRHAFNQDNLVLFLGAGVSAGEGLPGWEKLVQLLIQDFLKSKYDKVVSELDEDLKNEFKSFSYITLGRFIKKALKSKFHDNLKKVLYRGYSSSKTPNSLLNDIAEFCRPIRGKYGVLSIITYNYDDILESYLERKGIKHKVIYREYDTVLNDTLPIYHVHGFLPQGKLTEDMKDSIVFAEEEYHSQYKNPFSWQNLTQLNLLKEKTVLFIGMSGTDPNLRRLLDIAKGYSKDTNHYMILKNHWDLKNEKLSNIFRNVEEDVFEELGINVIWYENYSEINEIINQIK